MNELKSYTEYAVSTPTADFVIGFDFNYGEDAVNVTVDGVPASIAGYTVVYLNETTIRLSPSVPSGVVRLQRETDIDQSDHVYRAGAKFIAQTMDENFEQLRHSQQEVRDGFSKLAVDQEQKFEDFKDSISYTELRNTVQEVHTLKDQTESYAEVVETNYENSQALLGYIETFAADAEQAKVRAVSSALEAHQYIDEARTYVDTTVTNQTAAVSATLTAQTDTVNTALSNLSTSANRFYPTLAEANAEIASIAANQPVTVGEVANGGLWYKATAGATSLTKSPYDPVKQAKIYTNSKIAKGLNDFPSTSNFADYYIQFDGYSATMAGWQQTKFPIVAGKKYRLVANLTSPPLPNGSWTQFGAYIQSKGLILNSTNRLPATLALLAASTVAGSYVHNVDVDIDAVTDAQYLIVSQKLTDTVKLYEYYDLEPRLDNIEAQLPQITTNNNRIGVVETDLKNKAAVLPPAITDALYLNYVGTANNDANYEIHRYQVNEGDLVFVDGQLTAAVDSGSATTVGVLGFYTGTSLGSLVAGSLITQTEGTAKTYSHTLIAPTGARYVNVSVKKGVDVVVAKKSLNLTPVHNRFQNIITLWGDSITWGSDPQDNVTWAQRLQTLIGKRATVLNCGIGGDGIWQISARAGAIPAINNADFVLPALASESVQVGSMTNYIYNGFFKTSYGNSKDVIFLYQGETGRWESIKTVNPIYVDGIECTLSVNKVDNGNMAWFLKRNADAVSPRTIYTKTPFYTNGAKAIKSIASVFWMGTNESFTGGVIDLDVYVDVLKRNIQYQGVSRCVVIGVYGGTGISGMSVAQLEAMETRMQKEFGGHYINMRKYVTTNALADAGITPTQADTDAIALGKCPPSLLADGLHPNAAFSELIAKKVFEKLEMQGGIYIS